MPRTMLSLSDVRQLPITHQATIPEEYLDAMGHMNVMWYTHLFSLATGGVLQEIGLSWEQIEQEHGGTFALETHVRYLSEVRVGQSIAIHSRVLGRSEKRYHLMQFMANQDKQDVAATMEMVGAFVDLRVRRMAALPEAVTAELDRLFEEHCGLSWPAPTCGSMAP